MRSVVVLTLLLLVLLVVPVVPDLAEVGWLLAAPSVHLLWVGRAAAQMGRTLPPLNHLRLKPRDPIRPLGHFLTEAYTRFADKQGRLPRFQLNLVLLQPWSVQRDLAGISDPVTAVGGDVPLILPGLAPISRPIAHVPRQVAEVRIPIALVGSCLAASQVRAPSIDRVAADSDLLLAQA
jgi:hypothetical protein